MAAYRVTYCDFEGDRHVAPDGGVRMEVDDILRLMDEILVAPGSFVSLEDGAGRMLQVLVDDDGSLFIDFPSPRERGSYNGPITRDAAKVAIRAADGQLSRELVDGLGFERW